MTDPIYLETEYYPEGSSLFGVDDSLSRGPFKARELPRAIGLGAVGLLSDVLTLRLKAFRRVEKSVAPDCARGAKEVASIGHTVLAGGAVDYVPTDGHQPAIEGINPLIVESRQQFADGIVLGAEGRGPDND